MQKAVCFPHSDDQFKTPAKLMSWLEYSLRKTLDGYYMYRKGPAIGKLDQGSLVFFYKSKLIVGCAVVEKASMPLEQAEIERCKEIYGEDSTDCNGMENVVKFFTDSIWVWNEQELVNEDEFKSITEKSLSNYPIVEPDEVLKLYEIVAKKRETMNKRV